MLDLGLTRVTDALMLAEARDLIDRFHAMIRWRIIAELDPWINNVGASLMASFAKSVFT